MRFVLYTPWVSPHQVPLARELVKCLGAENFCYAYTEDPSPHQLKWGWDKLIAESWMKKISSNDSLLLACGILLTGVRDLGLLQARAARGLTTLYMSERWFKPMRLGGAEGLALPLPGIARMAWPRFRRMAKGFVKLVNESAYVKFLPIGPWAKKDFIRIGVREDKVVPWGYFVAPSEQRIDTDVRKVEGNGTLKVLWAGRMLKCKRVDSIIIATKILVGHGAKVELTLVGDGPEKARLERLAVGLPITFIPSQTGDRVREIMRAHNTFVLASDAYEGWGAVVSEALEEGLDAIGTFEAGASAAMLPRERLFHAGDARALARLLEREGRNELPLCLIGDWSAKNAAKKILGWCNG